MVAARPLGSLCRRGGSPVRSCDGLGDGEAGPPAVGLPPGDGCPARTVVAAGRGLGRGSRTPVGDTCLYRLGRHLEPEPYPGAWWRELPGVGDPSPCETTTPPALTRPTPFPATAPPTASGRRAGESRSTRRSGMNVYPPVIIRYAQREQTHSRGLGGSKLLEEKLLEEGLCK